MHDLRLAVRALRATPVVSVVAILSLSLGIGANTAVFSILNSLLLKPLPVAEPHRLVVVSSTDPGDADSVSFAVWQQVRDRGVFDRPFAWATDRVSVSRTGESASVEAIWATGNYFDGLGAPAILGRTFGSNDDRPGGGAQGPVAVISDRMWQAGYDRAPDVIGHTLRIERVPFTIVGVTAPEFMGLNVGTAVDVILPLETEPLIGHTPPPPRPTLAVAAD